MKDSILFMILFQIIMIFLNAVFACAEIAIISVNDTKLAKMAEDGDKRARRLQKLKEQSGRFLSAIQIAITLSGFLGSAFAADNFSELIVGGLVELGVTIPANVLNSIAVVLITIILSYFTLVFGELVPKQIAMRKTESVALAISGLISGISRVFSPIVNLLTVSTNGVLRLIGIDPNAEPEEVGEEEIRMMVDAGSEKGTIDHEERTFIQNVFEFDDISADEIVTHRTDVIMLDINDTVEEWDEVIHSSKHTRYPIFDETVDKIVGILNAKEYFRLEDRSRENIMKCAVKTPYFVPDTVRADTLFRNMKKGHHTLAVVMDEYGGMSGIITMNDLVEQLVGDLGDETEREEEELIRRLGESRWEIQGNALLEDVMEQLGLEIEDEEEFDTFSGYILHEIGSIPEDGSIIEVDVPGLHIGSARIADHQIETAIVEKIAPEEEKEENGKAEN